MCGDEPEPRVAQLKYTTTTLFWSWTPDAVCVCGWIGSKKTRQGKVNLLLAAESFRFSICELKIKFHSMYMYMYKITSVHK